MSITVSKICKSFGSTSVLREIDLQVPSGTLAALLGPSGSGKTTLLRIIAGLEQADSGAVLFDQEEVTHLHPRLRNVGFVFQHYALFRHMTVYDNIAFGLRVRRVSREEIKPRVMELLSKVRLEGMERRYPSQLSGGQRQRVALARALAVKPKLLLLDEPFGALDAKVRVELRQWLRMLQEELHITTVFVTHDREEAFEVADQVVVMDHGQIEQTGSPQEVFDHPATPFVMDFLGNVNVFSGRVENGSILLGDVQLDHPHFKGSDSQTATGYIRAHELEISHTNNGRPSVIARVMQINAAGSVVKVRVVSDEFGLALNIDLTHDRFHELQLKRGDQVHVTPRNVRVFPTEDYII